MAVNTSHRKAPTEMNVITKAKDVFKHSRLMIKTDKHFPKKERFMMVKDIYELSKEIVTKLIAANDYMLNDRGATESPAEVSAWKLLPPVRICCSL